MVLVLYIYNLVCHVLLEQRYISTIYEKTMTKNVINLWKRRYSTIVLQLLPFSAETQNNFHGGNLANLQDAWAFVPLKHQSMYLNIFQNNNGLEYKLNWLYWKHNTSEWSHYIRASISQNFCYFSECSLLSYVTASTSGQNCSLAVRPLCQPLK